MQKPLFWLAWLGSNILLMKDQVRSCKDVHHLSSRYLRQRIYFGVKCCISSSLFWFITQLRILVPILLLTSNPIFCLHGNYVIFHDSILVIVIYGSICKYWYWHTRFFISALFSAAFPIEWQFSGRIEVNGTTRLDDKTWKNWRAEERHSQNLVNIMYLFWVYSWNESMKLMCWLWLLCYYINPYRECFFSCYLCGLNTLKTIITWRIQKTEVHQTLNV